MSDPLNDMLNKPPTCDYCGFAHWPDEAHDSGSVTFQRNFERDHGRRPTYRDSWAHCEGENLKIAVRVCEAYGLDPDDPADLDGL